MLHLGTATNATLSKPNTSIYDPSRKTVGGIYLDAQAHNRHEDQIEIGDMSRELTTSLVDDINDAIKNFDLKGKPYYLVVHEKKDLQMKQTLARRILYFGYRPWPEDDTTVFWKDPKTQDLRFCWCLPHWSEMWTTLSYADQYDPDFIADIKAWQNFDLTHFGFYKHPDLEWVPIPNFRDRPLRNQTPVVDSLLTA